MLEVKNLHVRYGPVEVVSEVYFRVQKGQLAALLGSNGVGKTSILKAITGLIRPHSGEILFEGQKIQGKSPHTIVRLGIGQVMEGRRLFGGLSVEDNLLLGGCNHNPKFRRATLDEIFSRFPILKEKRTQLAGSLSGGQQQILALGRALMGTPKLLLLDEPSFGLAPIVVEELMTLVKNLRLEGMTILMVEQMANLALEIADYGYIMSPGRIAMEGFANEIAEHGTLKRTYLGDEIKSKYQNPKWQQ
jgi:branched-chain amino acid transport system ATP-binding protein